MRFLGKIVREKSCDFAEKHLTHILTHNRIAFSGQSSIFQNTMATKFQNPRSFQNFSKDFFCDRPVLHSMFKTSPIGVAKHG